MGCALVVDLVYYVLRHEQQLECALLVIFDAGVHQRSFTRLATSLCGVCSSPRIDHGAYARIMTVQTGEHQRGETLAVSLVRLVHIDPLLDQLGYGTIVAILAGVHQRGEALSDGRVGGHCPLGSQRHVCSEGSGLDIDQQNLPSVLPTSVSPLVWVLHSLGPWNSSTKSLKAYLAVPLRLQGYMDPHACRHHTCFHRPRAWHRWYPPSYLSRGGGSFCIKKQLFVSRIKMTSASLMWYGRGTGKAGDI